MNIFQEEIEQTSIERIRKFARIADTMGFDLAIGFSGGKDSQVVYDLCKRAGIPFKVYFNHSFESPDTLKFIREHYPEVIWRREHKFGFIENISKNQGSLLPTVTCAYCCDNYKHNPKHVDKCSIVGVRKAESRKRSTRTTISVKNKTEMKRSKAVISEYFKEECQSVGTKSIIQLLPIVDWTESDVWDYIKAHNLPVNPEYKQSRRVGCIVCPKANFNSNYIGLLRYPKLIDAFILARNRGGQKIDWVITSDNKDYSDDKPYYICRWLNHSFMPFTTRQQALYEKVREAYDKAVAKKNNKICTSDSLQ